jgi:nucleotide-binding universal stress UspA family protein
MDALRSGDDRRSGDARRSRDDRTIRGDRPVVVGVTGDGDVTGVIGVTSDRRSDRDVVAWGAREAMLRRRPLRLVHAYTPPPPNRAGQHASTLAAKQAHRSAQARISADRGYANQLLPALPVEVVVRGGCPTEVLREQADDAEIVVVGGGPEHHWAAGSTGAVGVQLAAHVRARLLVVRGSRDAGRSPVRQIVVGVAGPLTAEPLLEAAFLEAELRGCAGTLVELSRGAELLVVGTRGSGGFDGLRLGSVADAALRHADCPVLVVPTASPGRPDGRS